MQRFQYYNGNIRRPEPLGFVSLDRFIEANRSPKSNLLPIFEELSTATGERKSQLKASLNYFTPCVVVDGGRKYDNIVSFTGLAVLDFDKIDNAELFRDVLFDNYKELICVYCSPSKRGVKALISIPIVKTVDEFKSYFWGIADEMLSYIGLDQTSQNPVLPLFLSYDPDIRYRSDYTTWTVKGTREVFNPIRTEPIQVEITSDKMRRAISNFTKSIEKINSEGHPQLRSACIACGGYVASGYLSMNEAIQLAYNLIEANSYLQKDIKTYKKTAEWALNQGTFKQLILN